MRMEMDESRLQVGKTDPLEIARFIMFRQVHLIPETLFLGLHF